jgi:hypothetical protein
MARVEDVDVDLSPTGRVMEVLSEHICEGWLEDYLPTGVMVCSRATRRLSISSTPCSISTRKAEDHRGDSLAEANRFAQLSADLAGGRQDHNGFFHQDPDYIDHVANKSSDTVRIYLAPDANCPAVCSTSLFEVGITGLKKRPAHCRGSTTEPWTKPSRGTRQHAAFFTDDSSSGFGALPGAALSDSVAQGN